VIYFLSIPLESPFSQMLVLSSPNLYALLYETSEKVTSMNVGYTILNDMYQADEERTKPVKLSLD